MLFESAAPSNKCTHIDTVDTDIVTDDIITDDVTDKNTHNSTYMVC